MCCWANGSQAEGDIIWREQGRMGIPGGPTLPSPRGGGVSHIFGLAKPGLEVLLEREVDVCLAVRATIGMAQAQGWQWFLPGPKRQRGQGGIKGLNGELDKIN